MEADRVVWRNPKRKHKTTDTGLNDPFENKRNKWSRKAPIQCLKTPPWQRRSRPFLKGSPPVRSDAPIFTTSWGGEGKT